MLAWVPRLILLHSCTSSVQPAGTTCKPAVAEAAALQERRLPSGSSGVHALRDQAQLERRQQHQIGTMHILLYGAIAGMLSEACIYPLEVVRRRMQMAVVPAASRAASQGEAWRLGKMQSTCLVCRLLQDVFMASAPRLP